MQQQQPRSHAASVLSTSRDLRRRHPPRSMTTAKRIYNPIKPLHDAVVQALSSLLRRRLANTDRRAKKQLGHKSAQPEGHGCGPGVRRKRCRRKNQSPNYRAAQINILQQKKFRYFYNG